MADLTVTAANVATVSGTTANVTAGATITAGMLVYKNLTTGEYEGCDADASATAELVGVALNGASDGQPLAIQTDGVVNAGATVTVGQIYVVSTTVGGIAPYSDLGSGDYVTIFGIGKTAATILIGISISKIAKP